MQKVVGASQLALVVKNPPAKLPVLETKETWIQSLGQEDPLEDGIATYSSILVWRIPWTEESYGLQSIGSQRVGHDWSNLAHTSMVTWPSAQAPRKKDKCQGEGQSFQQMILGNLEYPQAKEWSWIHPMKLDTLPYIIYKRELKIN